MATDLAEPVTEEHARTLLADVRAFRTEWALFAVQSKDIFDAFREKGASLPSTFLGTYNSFVARKAALATKISESVTGLDAEEWSPPAATDTLHEFEHKLDDLIKFARELAKIISEKRERYVATLSAIGQLRSADQAIESQIAKIREESAQELTVLSTRPSRLADIELEGKVSTLNCLLALVDDARARLGVLGQGATLTPAECQANFESVSLKFGIALAIEAIRSGFALPASAAPRQSVEHTATSDVAKNVAVSSTNISTTVAAVEPAATLASRTAIQSLVQNLTAKPQAILPNTHRSNVLFAASASSPNPVSLSELADAGNRLKIKAHSLSANAFDAQTLESNLTPDKIRAIGYNCLASVIEMAGYIFSERARTPKFLNKMLHDFLLLYAEVQNSVRVEGERSGVVANEQAVAFRWLKHTCSDDGEQILIERFMRLEDRADPESNPDLAKRVQRQYRQLATIRKSEQNFADLIRCCEELKQTSENAALGLTLPLWSRVNELVKQLIIAGVKPSETKLRDVLLPIIDDVPEATISDENVMQSDGVEISDEFHQVIDLINDFLATQPGSVGSPAFDEVTPEVVQARKLLTGKTLIVIGGVCKPHAAQRLKHQLQLENVRWLEATKRDRVSDFRTELNGAAVVVLITKLIGHKHNDVREMCREAGIPWVQTRQAAGYSVNQVAAAILEQASEQLQAA